MKSFAANQLETALGRSVAIGSLETDVFSSTVLRDVRIDGRGNDDRFGSLSVGRIDLQYRILSVLSGRFTLSSIIIDSVHVELLRDSGGTLILPFESVEDSTAAPAPPEDDAGALKLPVIVEQATVSALTIRYRDIPMAVDCELRFGSLSVVYDEADSYLCEIELPIITAGIDSIALPSVAAFTRMIVSPDSVLLDTLHASIGGLNVDASGTLLLAADTSFAASMTVRGRTDSLLQPLTRYFGLPTVQPSGDLDVVVQAGGDLHSPKSDAVVSLPAVTAGPVGIRQSNLRLSYASDTLTIDTIHVPTLGGTVAGRMTIVLDSVVRADAGLSFVSIDAAELWGALYDGPSPYRGRLDGSITASRTGDGLTDMTVQAHIGGRELAFRETALPDLNGTVDLREGNLSVAIELDELSLTAQTTIRDQTLDGRFAWNVPRLDIVAGLANLAEVRGKLGGSGTIAGTTDHPQLTADIHGSRLSYRSFPVDTLAADLTYGDSGLTVRSFFVEGVIDSIDESSPPFGIDSLHGSVAYSATAQGTVDRPTARARAVLKSFHYGSYSLDSAIMAVRLDNRTAVLDTAAVFARSLSLSLSGFCDLDSLVGAVDLRLADSRPRDDGADSDDGVTVKTIDAGWVVIDFNLADSAAIAVVARGERISLGALAVVSDSLPIDGTLSFEGAFRGSLQRPDVELLVSVHQPRYDALSLDSVTFRSTLSPEALTIDSCIVDGLGKRLTLEASVPLKRDRDGMPSIDQSGAIRAEISTRDFDLNALTPFIGEGRALDGRMSIDLAVDGSIDHPHVSGTVGVQDASLVAAPGMDTLSDIQVNLQLADSILLVEQARAHIRRSPVALSGSLMLRSDTTLDLSLSFETEQYGGLTLNGSVARNSLELLAQSDTLRLEPFRSFLPEIDTIGGYLICRITASGSLDRPALNGFLSIRDLAVKAALLDSAITDGTADITFTRDQVVIDTLSAHVGAGRMWMSGWLRFDDSSLTSADVRAYARGITASSEKLFAFGVDSADIQYAGSAGSFTLGGPVALAETRFVRSFDLTDVVAWLKSVEQVERTASPWQRNTTLDIRLRNSGPLWIDNNLAHIRLSTGVGIVGSVADPNLTGRIRIEEGYILYLDREFNIVRGVALFSDPAAINPDLDFAATAEVTGYSGTSAITYVIALEVTGPLDQYQLRLTSPSHPNLSRSDIISLLTVGATREQLTGRSQQDVLVDRAGELVSRRIAGYASRQIEEAFGLSEVSVQGNLFDSERDGGAQVLVSKRLSQRVKVTYSTRVGGRNDQTIRLDYRLSDRWSVEGETSQTGEAVLNIKYGLRFK